MTTQKWLPFLNGSIFLLLEIRSLATMYVMQVFWNNSDKKDQLYALFGYFFCDLQEKEFLSDDLAWKSINWSSYHWSIAILNRKSHAVYLNLTEPKKIGILLLFLLDNCSETAWYIGYYKHIFDFPDTK